MKKFLLLLSCFLATWCGVQAASYDRDRITSATYDPNTSTIEAYFSVNNVSMVKLGLLSPLAGNSIYNPYSPKTLSVPNQYAYPSCTTLDVDPSYEECTFEVVLYVNNNSTPCDRKKVNVTAKGKIKNVTPNINNKTLTVNYSMQHGSAYNSTLRIYDESGNLVLSEKLKPNPNILVNKYKDYSFSYANKLVGGKYYTCKLYSNEKFLAEYKFKMPTPPPSATGELNYLSYVPDNYSYTTGNTLHSFTVNYSLRNATSATNATITIYDNAGQNPLKSVKITNAENKTITIDNAVDPNNYYQVCICFNGKRVTPLMQLDTHTPTPPSAGISDLRFEKESNRFWLKFYVTKPGVNVGFTLVPTHGLNGKTFDYNWGYCTLQTSDYYMNLPSGYDSGIYVIIYKENGRAVDSKQIYISK